jgi:hypothetical protein
MNIRSSGVAACLLAVVTAGCGTVTASPSGGGPTPTATGTGVPATGTGVHATASAAAATPSRAASTPSADTAVPSGCPQPAGGVLTLASNGKTYCVRVGEHFAVYLRGTVSSPWLAPLPSSNVIVGVPNGALSLVAGLTGGSFAGARPGRVLITSIRPPCAVAIDKNEAQPKFPVPKVYPLRSCAPERRFSVSIIVVS